MDRMQINPDQMDIMTAFIVDSDADRIIMSNFLQENELPEISVYTSSFNTSLYPEARHLDGLADGLPPVVVNLILDITEIIPAVLYMHVFYKNSHLGDVTLGFLARLSFQSLKLLT